MSLKIIYLNPIYVHLDFMVCIDSLIEYTGFIEMLTPYVKEYLQWNVSRLIHLHVDRSIITVCVSYVHVLLPVTLSCRNTDISWNLYFRTIDDDGDFRMYMHL